MLNVKNLISEKIIKALATLGVELNDGMVSLSGRLDLADYQSNVAMTLAKKMGKKPLDIAENLAGSLQDAKIFKEVSVAPPGFINMRISDELLTSFSSDFSVAKTGVKVVLDYGGPNIAKALHVGHLRSAIIGESVKRILRAMGDEVIGDVHFGDWGTPIGKLIAQLKFESPNGVFFTPNYNPDKNVLTISEMSDLYVRANTHFKEDKDFANAAREAVFDLQQGNPEYLKIWQMMRQVSVSDVKKIYDFLGVDFDLWYGESDVNDLLPKIEKDLEDKKLLVLGEGGAKVVFMPEKKDDSPNPPLMYRKSDGGYTYAATDICTIYQRVKDLGADKVIYVTDLRQSGHFEQVFTVCDMAGYIKRENLEHTPFGTVNGANGSPFSTRAGETASLQDLINLGIETALVNSEGDKEQAEMIAIAGIKYQDLKNNRVSDYVFDPKGFTSAEGKTGPYLQYAVVRINSILEKAGEIKPGKIIISDELERDLLLLLNQQAEVLKTAYDRREPSVISEYVYNVAAKFSAFYSKCPVINEVDESLRASRLTLLSKVREVMLFNMHLLGISAPSQMRKKK